MDWLRLRRTSCVSLRGRVGFWNLLIVPVGRLCLEQTRGVAADEAGCAARYCSKSCINAPL